MGNTKDLTGMIFGRLKVIEFSYKKNGKNYWRCECSCDNNTIKSIYHHHLTSGSIKSCGCIMREKIGNLKRTHGMSNSRIYHIWADMRRRCLVPTAINYSDYGGRGIRISENFMDFEYFYKWSCDNGYTDELTLDRIQNDGDYTESNCRFATKIEQSNNTRVVNKINYNGKEYTFRELSDLSGVSKRLIYARVMVRGWAVEKALSALKNESIYRRSKMMLTCNGETKTLVEWAEQYEITTACIIERLRRGMSEEEAITKPSKKFKYNKTKKAASIDTAKSIISLDN